jgi:hypothetical protein
MIHGLQLLMNEAYARRARSQTRNHRHFARDERLSAVPPRRIGSRSPPFSFYRSKQSERRGKFISIRASFPWLPSVKKPGLNCNFPFRRAAPILFALESRLTTWTTPLRRNIFSTAS